MNSNDTVHSRRNFMALLAAIGAGAYLPRMLHAADPLIAATFGGTWSEVHRKVLAPYFTERTGVPVSQSAMLATEQIAKLTAAGGNPPFDVAMLDEGPALQAIKQGLIAKYDAARSPNFNALLPSFKDAWGPSISMQCIGIAYNPKRIKQVPTSWEDLWNPEYKGRVGLTSLASTLGTSFLVEVARLNGGGEDNIDPAFAKLKTLLPNVGAVSANFGAHAALFSQEVVDIGVHNFNFVQTLKAKGVSVEFAAPATGLPGWRTTMHVVAGASQPDLAHAYVDSHLVAEVQAAMQEAPYNVIPTNGAVAMAGLVAEKLARSHAELEKKLVFHDWAKINEGRSEWSKKFNREIRV